MALFDERSERNRLRRYRVMFVEPGQQEQLLGKMGAAIDALYDPLHGELLLGDVLCHERDLCLHLDRGQRCLQLVCGVCGECSLALIESP